jgi:Ni,Fe-hydrogenase I cytochrome b subunit
LRQANYGWVVVLCAFTLMFVGFGAAYSFAATGSYGAPILGAAALALIAAAAVRSLHAGS